MRAVSLLYHDVVDDGRTDTSGFPGGDADIYKLDRSFFAAHLAAIAERSARPAESIERAAQSQSPNPLLLTFDDGGVSAYHNTAPMLEAMDSVGHFFITTDRIGSSGFLDGEGIAELHRRGHVIGSHTCSHPARMSKCSRAQLLDEWGRSLEILSGIVGEPVRVASVPGGYYSTEVAQTAAKRGVRYLFNSEPTSRVAEIDGCLIIGRYSVQRATPAETAAAIVAGRISPRLQQAALWNAKKLAKALGGAYWLALRKRLLNRPS